jgi:membrane associated rhomboid family serine protease
MKLPALSSQNRTLARTAGGLNLLLSILALMWLLEVADFALWSLDLDFYGIHPRTLIGLRNILFAPFLHVGFTHLLLNSIPFLFLGVLVLLRGKHDFIFVSIVAGVISGLGVWLFGGSHTIHLGMSGIIFGYLGFLLLRGFFERNLISTLLGGLAIFFYGGMLWGVLPLQAGVSWLGHLFGFIGGGVAAYLLTRGE